MLIKRHKVEGNFIKVTQRHVLGVIQRRTCTHVGGHGGTSKEDAVAKAITEKDIVCKCSAMFFWMLCYVFMKVVDVVDVLINNPTITS